MAEIGLLLLGACLGALFLGLVRRRPLPVTPRAGATSVAAPERVPSSDTLDESLSAVRANLLLALDNVQGEAHARPEAADLERAIASATELTLQLLYLRRHMYPGSRLASIGDSRPARPAADPAGTETILIVEDDDPIRAIAQRTLQRLGYSVLVAADPLQALSLLEDERHAIDLVLSDVLMPNMSGTELVHRVRERWPLVRVLYMSGYADEPAIASDIEKQGVALVSKPFTPDQLATAVRNALDALPDSRDESLIAPHA